MKEERGGRIGEGGEEERGGGEGRRRGGGEGREDSYYCIADNFSREKTFANW